MSQHVLRILACDHHSMSLPYALEKRVALAAVRRACALTSSVFTKLVQTETLTKGDRSPVTGRLLRFPVLVSHSRFHPVADYSAQAVVNTILARAFPDDPIVGEEDAADLRKPSPNTETLRRRIVELANEALTAPLTEDGDASGWGIGPGQERTLDELLDAIDRGCDQGGCHGRECVFSFSILRAMYLRLSRSFAHSCASSQAGGRWIPSTAPRDSCEANNTQSVSR